MGLFRKGVDGSGIGLISFKGILQNSRIVQFLADKSRQDFILRWRQPWYIGNMIHAYLHTMTFINIELKARTTKAEAIRQFLIANHADFKGVDTQTDTYFHVPNGRLKLRQGNIENNLIWYQRSDQAAAKQSDFLLTPVADSDSLLQTLTQALGVKVTVVKKREIYFIDNVKFHLDELEQLGSFVEIEASNKTKPIPVEQLKQQCEHYRQAFGIQDEDLLQYSYSDMLLKM